MGMQSASREHKSPTQPAERPRPFRCQTPATGFRPSGGQRSPFPARAGCGGQDQSTNSTIKTTIATTMKPTVFKPRTSSRGSAVGGPGWIIVE